MAAYQSWITFVSAIRNKSHKQFDVHYGQNKLPIAIIFVISMLFVSPLLVSGIAYGVVNGINNA